MIYGCWRYSSLQSFLTPSTRCKWVVNCMPQMFYPLRKEPSVCIGEAATVNPRARPYSAEEKNLHPCQESNPILWSCSTWLSHCTKWVIPHWRYTKHLNCKLFCVGVEHYLFEHTYIHTPYFIIIICCYILVDLSYIMYNDPWIQNKSNQIKFEN
jgi:hypothetical protein